MLAFLLMSKLWLIRIQQTVFVLFNILFVLVWLRAGGRSHGQMAVVHDLKAVGDYYVPLEHVCDGYQEQWDNCPGTCSTCALWHCKLALSAVIDG